MSESIKRKRVVSCYSTTKGHGYVGICGDLSFPWAKTPTGARRIMTSWLNSGFTDDQIRTALGCGWSVTFTAEHKDILALLMETES